MFSGEGQTFKEGVSLCIGLFLNGNTDEWINCGSYKYRGQLNEWGQMHGSGEIIRD